MSPVLQQSMLQQSVLRPADTGIKARLISWAMGHTGFGFRILRAVAPIARLGGMTIVTRYDDVREAFLNDAAFMVPYKAKLDVIMGGEPFFLGMGNTPEYQRDTQAMRKAVRPDDIPARLVPAVAQQADAIVAASHGRLEVVDSLVRQVTFDVLTDYFGTPGPANADLKVWATRLFEFQFADPNGDPALRTEVDQFAPALRAHVDTLLAARRGAAPIDDVLGRCLAYQAQGEPGFSDTQIRSALIGFIVGGLPQPPMVVPQALEQLLARPDALAGAQDAARADKDAELAGYVFEAMRFDPLAPGLFRTAVQPGTIARGTGHERTVPPGARVLVSFASAMMDQRRVPDPGTFNPARGPEQYMHFGAGLHTCFGIRMNQALLPLMLKPLLQRRNLRRASGPEGHLSKRGAFADRLVVEFDR